MWRHFSHAADIGVHGSGDSPEQTFEEAGVAMTAVITDPENAAGLARKMAKLRPVICIKGRHDDDIIFQ